MLEKLDWHDSLSINKVYSDYKKERILENDSEMKVTNATYKTIYALGQIIKNDRPNWKDTDVKNAILKLNIDGLGKRTLDDMITLGKKSME